MACRLLPIGALILVAACGSAQSSESRFRIDLGGGAGFYVAGSVSIGDRMSVDLVHYNGSLLFSNVSATGIGFSYYSGSTSAGKGKLFGFLAVRAVYVSDAGGDFLGGGWGFFPGGATTGASRYWAFVPAAGLIYNVTDHVGIGLQATPMPVLALSFAL